MYVTLTRKVSRKQEPHIDDISMFCFFASWRNAIPSLPPQKKEHTYTQNALIRNKNQKNACPLSDLAASDCEIKKNRAKWGCRGELIRFSPSIRKYHLDWYPTLWKPLARLPLYRNSMTKSFSSRYVMPIP